MAMALGQLGIETSQVTAALTGGMPGPTSTQFALLLKAVSCGAVMMGANTYIGNAPNFMVLSIAKEHGVKMPSFFGLHVLVVGSPDSGVRARDAGVLLTRGWGLGAWGWKEDRSSERAGNLVRSPVPSPQSLRCRGR